jgi:uncharacterized protein (DUF4415 family)
MIIYGFVGRNYMAKKKKPNLKRALSKVDSLPSSQFGNVQIDISTLPCLQKIEKEKITANLDSDVLAVIRKIAKKNDVAYTTLMNDVLRKVFIDDKKVG